MAKSMDYRYVEEVHKHLDFWPAWLPVQRVELGAIGYLRGFKFQRRTSLDKLGIAFETEGGGTGNQNYATKNACNISAKLMGAANAAFPSVPKAKAGLKVAFERDWCVVLAASGIQQTTITDLDSVASQLPGLPAWDPDWALITEVMTAASSTVLIAESKKSTIEISADVDVTASIASLANASAGLSTALSSSMSYDLVAEGSLTPLYRVTYREDLRPDRRERVTDAESEASLVPLAPALVAEWYDEA